MYFFITSIFCTINSKYLKFFIFYKETFLEKKDTKGFTKLNLKHFTYFYKFAK